MVSYPNPAYNKTCPIHSVTGVFGDDREKSWSQPAFRDGWFAHRRGERLTTTSLATFILGWQARDHYVAAHGL